MPLSKPSKERHWCDAMDLIPVLRQLYYFWRRGVGVNRHPGGFFLPALTMQTSTSCIGSLVGNKIGFGR